MVEEQEQENLSLDLILGKWSKGENRQEGLKRLAELLKEIDSRLDCKQSARGWCYTLENEGLINKDEFDRAEKAINECRIRDTYRLSFVLKMKVVHLKG